MSKDDKDQAKASENTKIAGKKKEGMIWILVSLALIMLGSAYYVTLPKGNEDLQAVSEAYPEADGSVGVEDSDQSAGSEVTIDVNDAKRDRILGNPSAPIKISEHASLTCGHCGHFHKTTFAEFKEKYIDTGKAYLIYSDFPLNAPALHATMISRCLPEDKYFDFIHDLFEHQDDWAYSSDYLDYLKTKSMEYGLSEEKYKACINSKELQEAIAAKREAAQKMWNINSTPSFVVNNQVVISGAFPYEEFVKKIDEAIDEINGVAKPDEEVPSPEPETEGE